MKVTIFPSQIDGKLTAPSSKSVAQRAIAIATLVKGTTTIRNITWSSDVLAALDFYQQMSIILQTIGLSIITVELNSNDSWVVGLSNGISLQLGDENVLTRLRHFVKVYPVVFTSTHKQAQSVDMRYENGMAVAWR